MQNHRSTKKYCTAANASSDIGIGRVFGVPKAGYSKVERFFDVTDHPDAFHRRHDSFHVIDVWPFHRSYGDEADLHNRWISCWTAWDAREVSLVRAKNASGQRETLQLNRSYGNEANLH
jgi:hypothetical protein